MKGDHSEKSKPVLYFLFTCQGKGRLNFIQSFIVKKWSNDFGQVVRINMLFMALWPASIGSISEKTVTKFPYTKLPSL